MKLFGEAFFAEKREACSSIHEPFVRFDFVDGPFYWSLIPGMSYTRSDSFVISLNPIHKTHEFFHPSAQKLRLPFAEQVKKRLNEAMEATNLLRTF